jgi:hypothetical protein
MRITADLGMVSCYARRSTRRQRLDAFETFCMTRALAWRSLPRENIDNVVAECKLNMLALIV